MTTDTPTRHVLSLHGSSGHGIAGHASPTLARLLDDELRFSPSFRGMYSSHLAMALVALEQMDAPPAVLQATFDRHASGEFEPRDDRDVLDERVREVRREGIAATVRTRVAALVDGPSTALFHPLIRLGYALDVGHEGQVAAALLDWERRLHILPTPPVTTGSRRLADVAADLAAHPAGTWPPTFDLDGISRRAELRAALDGVALDEHTLDEHTLDDVSSFAIAAHVAAGDFITLHLVTGARAMRTVAGWLDPEMADRLAAHMVPAMAVAYAAAGAAPLRGEAIDPRTSPLPSRTEIAERAIADRDPHVIKLANAALVEEIRTSDMRYRLVAARAVGLSGPSQVSN